MWIRFCIACIFLCTLVSTASISSREDVTDDEDVDTKSNIPLVVSIPSKVFRANKFNENDIRGPVASSGRPKQFAVPEPTAIGTSTKQAASKPREPVLRKTATEPVVTTTEKGSTDDGETNDREQHQESRHNDDSIKDTIGKKEEDEDERKAAAVPEAEGPRDVAEPLTDAEEPSRKDETLDGQKDSHDDDDSARTTATASLTTAASTKKVDEEVATAVVVPDGPSPASKNASARVGPSDEVVERDYGLSLEDHHDEEVDDGRAVAASEDESNDGQVVAQDSDGNDREAVAGALDDHGETEAKEHVPDHGETEAEEHAQDRIDTDVAAERVDVDVAEEDTGDEVDPFEEAAQASEVDYAVLSPSDPITGGDSRDLSALHHQTEEELVEQGEEDASSTQGPSTKKDVDGKSETSRTAPKEKGSSKKALEKPVDQPNPKDSSATETRSEVTESSFVVLLDSEPSTTASKEEVPSAVTTAALPESTKKGSGKPKGTGKKLVQSGFEDKGIKDLEPAESSQDSPAILNLDGGEEDTNVGEVSALTGDVRSSIVDSAADAAHDPGSLGDEGEYEYIYEYLDLNSTDLPENLPEGSVIISEDGQLVQQQATPDVKAVTEEAIAPVVSPALPEALSDNGTLELDPDIAARPPSFRTFGPPVAINTADLSLIEGPAINATVPLPTVPIGPLTDQTLAVPAGVQQPTTPGLPTTLSGDHHAPLPFIPGVPESPVYFVGIQREKLPPGFVPSPDTLLTKDAGAISETNVLDDGKQEKVLGGKGDRDQLNALYALSRALPLDDNLPFLVTDADDNATVVLPPDLPDPFSEELLGDVQSTVPLLPVTPTLPLAPDSPPDLVPSTITATETPSTEAIEPSKPLETTASVTEAATSAASEAEDSKPATKVAPRGSRPGLRRRVTTTTTTETASSTEAEAAATTTTTASSASRRGGRPNRVGGRRKITTERTTTAAPEATTAEAEATEKPSGPDRSRFASRGRGRLTTRAGTTTTESDAEASSPSDKDKDSNTIANGNKRPGGPGRRVPLRTTTTTTPGTTTNGEKDSTTRSAAPARGRRPQFRRTNEKSTEEKTTTAATTTTTSDGSTPSDDTTTRKQPLFRPRGRGRFSKKPAVADDADNGEDTHSAAESSASELKEVSPVAAESSTAPAPTEGEAAAATEAAPTEASGPPRKFPPRFRPGARARIPHRSTEAANVETEN